MEIQNHYPNNLVTKFFLSARMDSAAAAHVQEIENSVGSVYPVDNVETFNIPSSALSGRVGDRGKTFTAMIDLESLELRVDCAEELSFWLRISLSKSPLFKDLLDKSKPLSDTTLFKELQKFRSEPQHED